MAASRRKPEEKFQRAHCITLVPAGRWMITHHPNGPINGPGRNKQQRRLIICLFTKDTVLQNIHIVRFFHRNVLEGCGCVTVGRNRDATVGGAYLARIALGYGTLDRCSIML
ncbi:hypothetical protein DPEC_G00295560 [Dallia pectoralis]|uniref:Uncharacterized protein n=1 Tax=Dallia pectoralis TaxID=75939 RepID=A0ACC2FIS7_DALPE|nr:hypothetical protein DPEC_G00295560 [Dallia pectoralis]